MATNFATTVPKYSSEEHATALDVVKQQGPAFSLKGKTVLITGTSSGIGLETLRAFAATGARVFSAVRDVERTRPIVDKIAKEFPNNGGLEIVEVDLNDFASINKGADDFLKRSSELHIFVGNAGAVIRNLATTKDGFEQTFGMNHLGHFLLFKRLADVLVKSSSPQFHSRVVLVSSGVHHWGPIDFNDLHFTKGRQYNPNAAYAQSKSANILTANEIERRYGAKGVHGLSLNPGFVHTRAIETTTNEEWVQMGLFDASGKLLLPLRIKNPEQGAATSVFAAIDKSLEGQGGKYLDDIKVVGPAPPGQFNGYAAHVVDEDNAKRLWEYSEKAVHL